MRKTDKAVMYQGANYSVDVFRAAAILRAACLSWWRIYTASVSMRHTPTSTMCAMYKKTLLRWLLRDFRRMQRCPLTVRQKAWNKSDGQ